MKKNKLVFLLFSLFLFSCHNVENSSTSNKETSSTNSESSIVENTPSINDSSTIINSSSSILDSFSVEQSSSIEESSSIIESSTTTESTYIEQENEYLLSMSSEELTNLSLQGYAASGIKDFKKYVNTDAYKTVSNADEFIDALNDAKYDYETIWDENSNTYTQTLNKEGSVKVIEIVNDINLGYYILSSNAKSNTSIVSDYASKYNSLKDSLYFSDMFLENGISQIKIERTSNLLIYSKNGAKLTHAGFKLTSCDNIVFRNIFFDKLWQWEDAILSSTSKIGDYDYFGWSYFKIGFCGNVWIDHCKFGKSYDGQIDYANANYSASKSTSFRAPYGANGNKGISITWCDFAAGDDDQDGYIYQMMNKLEQDYQKQECKALYYKALRDNNVSFEDILYGLAIPQKKGFLIGDDQDYKDNDHAEYDYNLELFVTFANCKFTDLEDRLPKVRGGNIYMHNCLFDSSRYYSYRSKLKSLNVQNIVKTVNSGWKCALTSQGIVCGQGGSVKAVNCIFLGISSLLKNNDSGSKVPYNYGGSELINCRYVCDNINYTGSSSDASHKFKNDSTSTLKTEYFKWNTIDGNAPYEIEVLINLEDLIETLNNEIYGAGTSTYISHSFMTFTY